VSAIEAGSSRRRVSAALESAAGRRLSIGELASRLLKNSARHAASLRFI
jgi:hypothetical protein